MIDMNQRRLLGAFVRAHRERLASPDPSGRRRTPGLRREELAARAGISATWCAWIEQGRTVQASPEALARLAEALALTPAERAYLFDLAGRVDRPDAESVDDVPASLGAAVAALPYPAYGLDRLWNACCWNDAAAALFRGWLDGDGTRNLLRFVFLEADARRLIPDWEERARRLLAEFRVDYVRHLRDARLRGLVSDLEVESSLFARAWHEQDVQQRSGGTRSFVNAAGRLRHYAQHTYHPAERPDCKLVMLVPLPVA